MEVILIKDVENLGYANDIVNVKPGYANNYLIPQGFAKAATASAKKVLAENLRQRAHKDAKILADAQAGELRYLNPVSVDVKKKKYCRFKKVGIKYVDYKDGEFLKKFLNEQGKILPRRLTGTSQKFQKKVAQAVKRARHLAILPFVTDCMK